MDWSAHEQERALADHAANLSRRPLAIPALDVPFRIVVIGGGNTIDTQDGIKSITTPITDIPTAYNPNSSPSCIDGVGWGRLYENGIDRGNVLVANDTRSSFQCFLIAGDQVYATPINVTVGGSGSARIYVAG